MHYVIKIAGCVDKGLVDWFGPVTLARAVEDGEQVVTTLSCVVADQAALVGLIRHLHGLGIELLSVQRVAADPLNT